METRRGWKRGVGVGKRRTKVARRPRPTVCEVSGKY